MWLGEDDGKTTAERAEEALERSARIYQSVDRAVGGKGWTAEKNTNAAIGQNILREEIGFFGPWDGAHYAFDQETRDRLLAHGRQDAATAFVMSSSAFREAYFARRLAIRTVILMVVLICINVAALVALWWWG